MKKIITLAYLIAMAMPLHASATVVSAFGQNAVMPAIVDLGEFQAGTYVLTGSGAVDLVPDTSFTIRPDGTPATVVSASGYAYFNPSGSFTADGHYGPAGANAKIGALIGTLNANPTSAGDWFQIGYSKRLTLTGARHIYAAVNDTFYPNNHGAFDVTVAAAVPEPESCLLMLTGLVFMGSVVRRKNKRVTPRVP